jgi:hypothetical protein
MTKRVSLGEKKGAELQTRGNKDFLAAGKEIIGAPLSARGEDAMTISYTRHIRHTKKKKKKPKTSKSTYARKRRSSKRKYEMGWNYRQ